MTYFVNPADLTDIKLNPANTVEAVLQNVALILATPKGSVPLYRDFGLSQDFLDKPIPAAKAMMIAHIREAIEIWEPRAEYVNATFAENIQEPGQLNPTVEVKIHVEES